jgi:uncharacterized protein YaeQ
MAQSATLFHVSLTLSDVERSVYEQLDLRLAQHPSESKRFLVTRLIAWALSYEEGIAFSKGGVSSTDEPAVISRDLTGSILGWIEVGSPSAERLHRASKASKRVALFTTAETKALEDAARTGAIHRAAEIEVWRFDPLFIDAVAERLERSSALELVHSGGRLYLTLGGQMFEGAVERAPLLVEPG